MTGQTIPSTVQRAVEGVAGRVISAEPLSGGCIAHATRVETPAGRLFLKWADGDAGAGFEGEGAGLQALADVAPADLLVPRPLAAAVSTPNAPGYLLSTWIEPASRSRDHSGRLGTALAELHRARAPASEAGRPYGFPVDTFCGPTRQPNDWMESWSDFFGVRRLAALADALRRAGRWEGALDGPMDSILRAMDRLLPPQPGPSLVHGDLWSGNVFPTAGGATAIVDPAAYVGHREVDLAMTELFGGFDQSFYAAYGEAWPLEPGYRDRRDVYNLYHVMNHALLFGGGYVVAVGRSVQTISQRVLPVASGRRP